jgi:chitinase
MMKAKILTLLAISMLFYCVAEAQDKTGKFRVVGYVRGEAAEMVDRIQFKKITHLNIAFINPDSAGQFTEVKGIQAVVAKAHRNGVKVLMAIAGGNAPHYYRSLIAPANRTLFIANLVKFMKEHNFDGIDVDIEGELITTDYEGFVIRLAAAVRPGKLLTAAVATPYGPFFTAASLAQFDFINVMSYDKTGPWRPLVSGPHSPFDMAVSDMDYWQNERKIPTQKLNLGVPFYGYSFGPSGAGSMSYKDIILTYPGAQDKDELPTADGGMLYYNGTATIKAKTKLAVERSGGMMIWQLLQDAPGSGSLLELMYREISAAGKH